MNQEQKVRWRKANLRKHVWGVITSCQNQEQLNAAENYACLAGLRVNPIVNEAINTMKQIFKTI
jgi:hypothetical protein